MNVTAQVPLSEVWEWLAEVPDPEIPVISVVDLGIVRDLQWQAAGEVLRLVVTVTPTYSGCPATEVIADSIRQTLAGHGIGDALLETRLSPPWTTDWLTPAGKAKLLGYGIAPPAEQVIDISRLTRRALPSPVVHCPRCGSGHTQLLSQFGSTPCKALYRCTDCLEPFDYFKCH